MPVELHPITPTFAAEVSGIDTAQPVNREDVAAIEAGMDKYAVLVFRNQRITDEQQKDFSRNFGALEVAPGNNITKPEDKRLSTGMNDVSNLGKDGKPLPLDSRQRMFNLGNMLWHSDSSFRPISSKYSLLSARVVNPKGGDTEFADMRAAYDTLDEETKREIENYVCEHSTQPRFVYVHKWRPYDLVMWDNRQTMHRGRRYDESQPRDVRRTTVAGDAPNAAQAAA